MRCRMAEISPSRSELRDNQDKELVLKSNSERWVLLPVEFPTIMEYYKKLETSFWTPEDFKWKQDLEMKYFNTPPQSLVHLALAYNLMLGVPAGVIGDTKRINAFLYPDITDLTCELTEAIQSPEARAFLGFQSTFENFSREALTHWTDILMASPTESVLFQSFLIDQERETLVDKQKWLAKHLEGFHTEDKVKRLVGDTDKITETICSGSDDPAPIAEVLVALATQKAIFFSGLGFLDIIFPHLGESALFLSARRMYADLNLHSDFALHLYSSFEGKIKLSSLVGLLVEAMELEYYFMCDLFAEEMNEEIESQLAGYLRSIVQRMLHMIYTEEYQDSVLPDDAMPVCECAVRAKLPAVPTLDHKGAFHVRAATGNETLEQSDQVSTMPDATFATDEDF